MLARNFKIREELEMWMNPIWIWKVEVSADEQEDYAVDRSPSPRKTRSGRSGGGHNHSLNTTPLPSTSARPRRSSPQQSNGHHTEGIETRRTRARDQDNNHHPIDKVSYHTLTHDTWHCTQITVFNLLSSLCRYAYWLWILLIWSSPSPSLLVV